MSDEKQSPEAKYQEMFEEAEVSPHYWSAGIIARLGLDEDGEEAAEVLRVIDAAMEAAVIHGRVEREPPEDLIEDLMVLRREDATTDDWTPRQAVRLLLRQIEECTLPGDSVVLIRRWWDEEREVYDFEHSRAKLDLGEEVLLIEAYRRTLLRRVFDT